MKRYNIPVFVPHKGCPHDCIFCNQKRIAGNIGRVSAADVRQIIDAHLATINRDGAHIEAAFFGGSFTGIPIEEQTELLGAAYEYKLAGKIDGIRLSTRPDYISRDILDNLKSFGVTVIELGVQSMDAEVLAKCERGYQPGAVRAASRLIKEYSFSLGLQMMTGLPEDNDEKALNTAREIIAMEPDCVRIYPTLVVKDTPLADMYENGLYTPQTVEEAVSLCKRLYKMFTDSGIAVIRISLQTTDEINPGASVIAGPFHASFGELVAGELFYDRMCAALDGFTGEAAQIRVNPKELSKAVGNRRRNIKRLSDRYKFDIRITADTSVEKGGFTIADTSCTAH